MKKQNENNNLAGYLQGSAVTTRRGYLCLNSTAKSYRRQLRDLLLGRIACTECKDAAPFSRCGVVCMSICLCVCLLDTSDNPTKTDEPIQMRFGLWIMAHGTMHYVRVPIPRGKGAFFVVMRQSG